MKSNANWIVKTFGVALVAGIVTLALAGATTGAIESEVADRVSSKLFLLAFALVGCLAFFISKRYGR